MKIPYIPLFLLVSITWGCNNSHHFSHGPSHAGQDDHSHHAAMAMEPTSSTPSGHTTEMSVYNLNSRWATQEGDSITLPSLKGKIRVIAMIYTSCDYACPRIIADLKRIEENLGSFKKEDIGITLITLDPERDTPENLKEFAGKNKLNPDQWLFLTGEENSIMELAALLNVRYRKELSMDNAHSNIISVLNKEGELIHQQEGLGVDPEETVTAITELLKKI